MNTRVSFLQRLRLLLLLSAACGWLSLSNPALADSAIAPVAIPSEMTGASTPALQAPHLSPLQMYQQADPLVRGVMLGLALASVLCWTIGLSKGLELIAARRRLRRDLTQLQHAHSLSEASAPHSCIAGRLLHSARDELQLSAQASDKAGIKERLGFRLERLVAQGGRQMGRGTGILASIGALAPFVGLFGTVWGIMNSFVAIAATHTTNLSVVAPGIAEALLATALGLVAAIPAVLLYNLFARSIGSYKAELADAAAQVLLLASRQLDLPAPAVLHAVPRAQPQ